jgi:hypothetical protein
MNGHHKAVSRRSSSSTSQTDKLPNIEVTLSRPSYRLGSSVVGTVRITPNEKQPPDTNLRFLLSSVVVYVAGFCRIDSRWHNVAEYRKLYGDRHPQLEALYRTFDPELLHQGGDEATVCFWATQGLELLKVKERTVGAYPDAGNQLAYTFRVDIPMDLPHSVSATTCRYFYSAEVLIKTNAQQKVIKAPFQVTTHPDKPLPPAIQSTVTKSAASTNQIGVGRVRFGICDAMAHAIGLPCHLSATERHRPTGQMTVTTSRQQRNDLQTLRVSNARGQPVCVLTVVGATKMVPGTRVHLKWVSIYHYFYLSMSVWNEG